jgi:hypothetical protein
LVGPLQASPARTTEPEETVTLIPMGAARLRIAAFPTATTGAEGHVWTPPSKPKPSLYKASASHCNDNDTVEALGDGLEPNSSNDQTIPRMTWWDHKGTTEWVEYDFGRARRVSSVSVYWFDDTGTGQCRVPRNWRVLYRDEDQWKEVSNPKPTPVARNRYNQLNFDPVQASGLRLEVQLQPGFSGGILEWRCGMEGAGQ